MFDLWSLTSGESECRPEILPYACSSTHQNARFDHGVEEDADIAREVH